MKFLITGDVVINKSYNTSNIDLDLVRLFQESDCNIINLEAPVTESNSKIIKTGPNIKSNKKSTGQVLKTLNVDVITLANNHVLDYDEQGVLDTLNFCAENSIQTVGAGENLKEASKTMYIDTIEGKVAIINFAENEWSSATEDTAGAHPMDLISNARIIKESKRNADIVFVIVHGGHEYYNLPSPRIQEQYRFYVDQGADIVIAHHTHCISGYEIYKGAPIYYSLGNFLFTQPSVFEDWYIGLILEIEIKDSNLVTRLHPIHQQKENFKLKLLVRKDKDEVLKRIVNYSKIIENTTELKQEWEKYIITKYDTYLNYWSPLSFISNRYLKMFLKKLKIRFLNKNGIALKLNLMRCESHVDISKEVTRKYLSK